MNEDFLSFVWRYQYFDSADLRTETGEALQILRIGQLNTDAGPDFAESRVLLDGMEWVGAVELHVKSSDWEVHRHPGDLAYESVVLHVVWDDDRPVRRRDGTLVPTLVLSGRVKPAVRERYQRLMESKAEIPCAPQFRDAPRLQKISMLDRVLLERLDGKAARVIDLWEENNRDWEETAYQWLAQYFGFRLNAPAFLRLARIIPLKVLQKHRGSGRQIEALLFGCSGLLPENSEEVYVQDLHKEYQFLATKYGLLSQRMELTEWKFLRLRPAGFPTVRLAQWATLLQREAGLFASLTSIENADDLRKMLRVSQSDYWKRHYQFGKRSASTVPDLGKDAADLLIINAAVPLLAAYARQRDHAGLLDRAVRWLEQISAEKNHITRAWEALGMRVNTAFDSQALIEWHTTYCARKRCLECSVGASLVRPA
ncbi:DUF2851 family protein [Persicitalea jodogahamensis]|uniref:DUF2851 family protein n=1 Tax=Persicitalea jodogahamensis TaxID=402147 RepID=A0A8J3D6G9_9BACT|nr:DUF2851 family protein [Persicitalea jodogahamensis]GHB57004.1 hypothetical protein GCM10007390_08030 [Persicitalea jodogahamensis]